VCARVSYEHVGLPVIIVQVRVCVCVCVHVCE